MLPYSKWKEINLRPRRKRDVKKFQNRYEYSHPRYSDYCFRVARATEPQGKRIGLSTNMMNAAVSATFTDVLLKKHIMKENTFLKGFKKVKE
jgi:hypothetical protein